MAAGFLSRLNLTDEETAKLASLGATTPLSLLGALRASPEAFVSFVGKDRADTIVDRISGLLTDEERSSLDEELPLFSLGARLGTPPSVLKQTQYDIDERDGIFLRLQTLRTLPTRTQQQDAEISQLERRLSDMLNSHVKSGRNSE